MVAVGWYHGMVRLLHLRLQVTYFLLLLLLSPTPPPSYYQATNKLLIIFRSRSYLFHIQPNADLLQPLLSSFDRIRQVVLT